MLKQSKSFNFYLKRLSESERQQLLKEFPRQIQHSPQVLEVTAVEKSAGEPHYLGLVYLTDRGNWNYLENLSEALFCPLAAAKNLLQRLLGIDSYLPLCWQIHPNKYFNRTHKVSI